MMYWARFVIVATVTLYTRSAHACTIIAVGKDASTSGHALVAHTDDSGDDTTDIRFNRVPRKTWPAGSMRPLYHWADGYPRVVSAQLSEEYAPVGNQTESVPMGFIPQVAQTWAYWDMDYGVQNERGLSIGESTCDAKTVGWPATADKPYGYNRAGIEELSKIALERCETARCAVQTMGDVAVEQGFYSADSGEPDKPDFEDSAEALVVADALGEIWIFDVLTGKNNASAIWAAQRVPSDHVTAVANSFTIRKMNLSDPENFLYSPGVTQLAEEMGWWSPREEVSPDIFDFYGAYGYTPSGGDPKANDFDKEVLAFYSARRMWRIFSLLSPGEGAKLDPNKGNLPKTVNPYPGSVPAPKGSVTLRMVMDVLRDHYEGTPYDLTQGMAAGPFGSPNRGPASPPGVKGLWERAISMYRGSWSYILEAKPEGRSVSWLGYDAPHGTAYLPFFGAATMGAPVSFHSHDGGQSKFSTKVAWWAFNLVNQYSDLNFKLINADVRATARAVEDEALQKVAAWEAEADRASNHESAMELLTMRSNTFAEAQVAYWWTYAFSLFAKYGRYSITYNESDNGETPQVYPQWWLNSPEVGFTLWTPTGHINRLVAPLSNSSHALPLRSVSISVMACAAVLMFVAFGAVYQAGVRKGRRSANMDVYIAQP